MKINLLWGVVVALLIAGCSNRVAERKISLIPQVRNLQQGNGNYFVSSATTISYSAEELADAARFVANKVGVADVQFSESAVDGIFLTIDASLPHADEYRLNISKSGVKIAGQSGRGVMLGIQTLVQLLPNAIESNTNDGSSTKWDVPFVNISDYPSYQWRGMMLDVSRHFYTTAEVKEFLDLMARYKFNKFHWHLTDDQGWRIEIKKYPLLTEKGGFRKFNTHDRECIHRAKVEQNSDFNLPSDRIHVADGDTLYGGFYTQDEIRDIVAHAGRLGIDVIPEIDMPGHFSAAIANYPYLSCFNQAGWGQIFSAPICPGKDEVLQFCEDVYTELFDLFPYEYYHLGADEVEKDNWKKCPNCQKRIKKEGLKNEEELQSWFVHHMEYFFNQNGKKLIGWDEILEGGLSETATIMWWRSWAKDAVHRATKQGNQAILTPNDFFYFDYAADAKTLSTVYAFNPQLEGLSPEQLKLIKGVQANIWCEWIPSRERMQYMIYPRMTALSEVVWGTADATKFDDYLLRLVAHYDRWDLLNINYRVPDLEGFSSVNMFTHSKVVDVKCLIPTVEIRYTTDGSLPTQESTLYTAPFTISESTDFNFRAFRKNGTADVAVKTRFVKMPLAEAATVNVADLKEGLECKIFEKRYRNCENFTDGAKLLNTLSVDKIAIPKGAGGWLGLELTAWVEIPADGIYTFSLMSDDGSRLYVNDYYVVDNDGDHGPRTVDGQYGMKAGLHALKIHYYDGNNGGQLHLDVLSSTGENVDVKYYH